MLDIPGKTAARMAKEAARFLVTRGLDTHHYKDYSTYAAYTDDGITVEVCGLGYHPRSYIVKG